MENKYENAANSVMDFFGVLSKEHSEVASGFMSINNAVMKDDALSIKQKELIALGIAISQRCEGCISAHVSNAVKLGIGQAEIMETIGVAIMMGGGPSITYGQKAYAAMLEFIGEDSK